MGFDLQKALIFKRKISASFHGPALIRTGFSYSSRCSYADGEQISPGKEKIPKCQLNVFIIEKDLQENSVNFSSAL